jgi:hypothetical protein
MKGAPCVNGAQAGCPAKRHPCASEITAEMTKAATIESPAERPRAPEITAEVTAAATPMATAAPAPASRERVGRCESSDHRDSCKGQARDLRL